MKSKTFSNGMAMFSMFFGAGNITFPLMIGQTVSGGLMYALLGLILTAVVIPFSGLMGITLFDGNYKKFFERIGKIPGMFVVVALLALIGPFGGIPRCISLTYATLQSYLGGMPLLIFSLLGCGVIFLFCFRKNRIIDLIGYVLTPILLISLGTIMVKGLFFSTYSPSVLTETKNPFLHGLIEGYNTMDLLAAFFFSSLICSRLKNQRGGKEITGKKALIIPVFKACVVGASLLSIVYIGFSYVAAHYRGELAGITIDQLLGSIGHIVLGPYAGFVVALSIALTCLTTAIALTVICSEFLQKEVFREKLDYKFCLVIILFGSCLVSTLEFSGIVRLLLPVLKVLYPALLALSLFNILHKLYDFKPVKVPVYTIFTIVLFTLIIK